MNKDTCSRQSLLSQPTNTNTRWFLPWESAAVTLGSPRHLSFHATGVTMVEMISKRVFFIKRQAVFLWICMFIYLSIFILSRIVGPNLLLDPINPPFRSCFKTAMEFCQAVGFDFIFLDFSQTLRHCWDFNMKSRQQQVFFFFGNSCLVSNASEILQSNKTSHFQNMTNCTLPMSFH